MANKTIAVIGATGHTGAVLADALLKKGDRVHAIGRDQRKLQNLKQKGAEIFSIDRFDRPAELTKAFAGCDAVFGLIPPNYQESDFEAYQDNLGKATKQAIVDSGIGYVVNLSSVGAHLPDGTGVIKGLYRQEKRLNEISKLNIIHLRPHYFMENLNWSIHLLKNYGILGTPVRADLPIPMIATHDIGLKAAEFLHALDFEGVQIFEQIGPKAITMNEVASTIGKAIGKPDLRYRQFPPDEVEKGLLRSGMKQNAVNLLLEMYKSINEEKFNVTQEMTPEHIGKTTIDEYAFSSFVPLYI